MTCEFKKLMTNFSRFRAQQNSLFSQNLNFKAYINSDKMSDFKRSGQQLLSLVALHAAQDHEEVVLQMLGMLGLIELHSHNLFTF